MVQNDVIAIGGDSNEIQVYDIKNKCYANTFTAHSNRLKAIQAVRSLVDIKEDKIWLVSVSSDSFIKVWELDLVQVFISNSPQRPYFL